MFSDRRRTNESNYFMNINENTKKPDNYNTLDQIETQTSLFKAEKIENTSGKSRNVPVILHRKFFDKQSRNFND